MTAKESKAVAWPEKFVDTPIIGGDDEGLGAYGTGFNAAIDRCLSALHAAEAELGELRRRVGVVAADLLESAGYCGYSSDERAVYAGASEQLRQLLASDGGAGGDNEGEGK